MRGCLTFLLLAAILVTAMAWFALPTLASAGITAALAAGGLSGTGTTVTVEANPPLELATLHADHIRIETADAHWNDVTAATLSISMDDVSLASRSFSTIDGRMTGVHVIRGGEELSSDLVTIGGSSAAAHAQVTVAPAEVQQLALAAAERSIGSRPTRLTLAPPNEVTLQVAGRPIVGRLVVDGSGRLLLLVQGVGSAELLGTGSPSPLTLTSVTVTTGGGLLLAANLELGVLTGG